MMESAQMTAATSQKPPHMMAMNGQPPQQLQMVANVDEMQDGAPDEQIQDEMMDGESGHSYYDTMV